MEQQQGKVYRQLALFPRSEKDTLRPGEAGDGGTGAGTYEEQQAFTASSEGRALAIDLMAKVCDPANLNRAYKRVKANKGSVGIDGMSVEDLGEWFITHKGELTASLLDGTYQPQPVKGVQIPKPGGGKRQLGIPTAVDRLVQRAILQVLEPILDPTFSESSYGFRRGRSAHNAIRQAGQYVLEEYCIVVDCDLRTVA